MVADSLVLIPCRPDPSSIDPQAYVNPINSFAMSLKEFIPHISKVLETVGLSLQARTNFLKYVLTHFLSFPYSCAIYSVATISRPSLRIGTSHTD